MQFYTHALFEFAILIIHIAIAECYLELAGKIKTIEIVQVAS